MLGNERGKKRLKQNATLEKTKEWRLCILSSSEIGIADKINDAGGRVTSGQLVRCIDIDATVHNEYGVFNTLHGCPNGAELSNLLKKQCSEIHGSPAKEFVTTPCRQITIFAHNIMHLI
jgi:uncharacterized protein (DUF927 family)